MPRQELPPGDGEPPPRGAEPSRIESEVVDERLEGRTSYHVAGEVIHRSVSFRQAPYPTPQDLREYEETYPGFTDRVLTLTERETQHRIQQEQFEGTATFQLARRGQLLAFIVVMTLVVGGIVAILTDHSIVGFAGLVLAAATLAGTFVGSKLVDRGAAGDEGDPGTELQAGAEPSAADGRNPDA